MQHQIFANLRKYYLSVNQNAWLRDYLQNPNVGLSEEDKRLCDDVK
jgi:hypothetical protein